MSEFKYACPVCGQHMMCDSSQAGTVMECPTCFQKITAPQAPAGEDQKFVLTGTKKEGRPVPKFPAASSSIVPVAKNFLGALVVILILIFVGAAAAFVYRGTIFKSKSAATTAANGATAEKNQAPVKTQTPPVSDTNWMLSLDGLTNFPDAAAVGRIHGQSATLERAIFQAGVLTLRPGARGSPDVSFTISFSGATPDALAGQTINVTTNADKAARVTLRWREGDQLMSDTFASRYALRLEFGALANNRLPGKIYFCAPDDLKSYVMGTFTADIRKPRTPKPKN